MNDRLIGITVADLQKLMEDVVEKALRKAKEELPKLYTIEDVMKVINSRSRSTIYNYIDKGVLKPIKSGGKVLFAADEVDRALYSGKLCKGKRT